MHPLARPVKTPSPGTINTGLSPLRPTTLAAALGKPRENLDQLCRPITNQRLRHRMITANVGPFRVTGLDVAVVSLRTVFARLKNAEPELYRQLGTAGMLCCRLVRGSRDTPSNHSWGTAIDLKIGGLIDAPGDGFTQVGLLRVYRFFRDEGWYWGAGFRREDSMHFELAEETFAKLEANRVRSNLSGGKAKGSARKSRS